MNGESKKNQRIWIMVGAILAGVVVIAVFVIFGPFGEKSGDEARAEINQLLATTIPDSATNLHWDDALALEWYAYARFDAPREDVEAWLADGVVCFDTVTETMNEGLLQTPGQLGPSWWERDKAEVYASDYCPDDYVNHPHLFLVIDQTDDDQWIVYLYADDT